MARELATKVFCDKCSTEKIIDATYEKFIDTTMEKLDWLVTVENDYCPECKDKVEVICDNNGFLHG